MPSPGSTFDFRPSTFDFRLSNAGGLRRGGASPAAKFAARLAVIGAALAGAGAPALAQDHYAECADCHAGQAQLFAGSVHRDVVRCQQCHGGLDNYELTPQQWRAYDPEAPGPPPDEAPPFDHGETYRGRVARADIPELCGRCHADVEEMNPYGLATDQLSAYRVSGHGRRLEQFGDERVAVCVDCHGVHDVLRHDNPASRTHFRNVPDTCAACHADEALMNEYELSADVVEQYRDSIHGRNVLQRGDAGSPNCATCHGSHGAAPPGYAEVGHVCGRCHKQIEDYVLKSVHGRIRPMARCTGCHGPGGDTKNHRIMEASPPVSDLVLAYLEALADGHEDPMALQSSFNERVDALGASPRLETVCEYCHAPDRGGAHVEFFKENDRLALERGRVLDALLRDAQFDYARSAERVERVSRGVLLVKDEAMRVDDAKTEVMALYSFVHTLEPDDVAERSQKVEDIVAQVSGDLDRKELGLARRRAVLFPLWAFILVFSVFMYRKYLALKRAYVRHDGGPLEAPANWPVPHGRRRFLDVGLSLGGAVAVVALAWPAIAYILPARRRGGANERASAGAEDGWELWHARKLAVGGKPVVVLRTESGFRAYSAVCTHLGCIVHWNAVTRDFGCPCHAATFDATGQVVSGPPPLPLQEYRVSTVQGEVVVTQAS